MKLIQAPKVRGLIEEPKQIYIAKMVDGLDSQELLKGLGIPKEYLGTDGSKSDADIEKRIQQQIIKTINQ